MVEYERIGNKLYKKTYYLPDENGIARKIEKIVTEDDYKNHLLLLELEYRQSRQ